MKLSENMERYYNSLIISMKEAGMTEAEVGIKLRKYEIFQNVPFKIFFRWVADTYRKEE